MSVVVSDCSCHKQLQEITKLTNESPEMVIYQTSLMSALLNGVYEGTTTIADLLKKGDFGVGTFNDLDGQLIVFEGNAYQLLSDGSASPAGSEKQTPFAVMTFFTPEYQYCFNDIATRADIHKVIDTQIPSDNQFCALRISGRFRTVTTRTVPRQLRPYRPMLEVTKTQPTFAFHEAQGELIGYRMPQYIQGINVAGYHEHFITEDRQGGGHILDYVLEEGIMTFGVVSKLLVDVPRHADFLRADLNPHDLDTAIRTVESSEPR